MTKLDSISTIDYHTGGEPFRVVTHPPVDLPGASVADRRARAMNDADAQWLRSVLCCEPRGHADMYGGFIVPPDDDGALLGVLFWHKDGFSTACGHGTIALGAWAVDHGLVDAPTDGSVDVAIDVPSGRVHATVHCTKGSVSAIDFVNVPSWVIARNVTVATSIGDVKVDIAYGGAIYASAQAVQLGLAVDPADLDALIAVGREIKWALNDSEHAAHPTDERLSGIYGTIWFDELGDQAGVVRQRNVTIFADGEVDRSPCGSGTSARMALLVEDGRMSADTTLHHESIVGSVFTATIESRDGEHIVPRITGMAYRTGEHTFRIDPNDPLVPGFLLR